MAGPWKQLGVLWKQAHLPWKPGSATCRQSDGGVGSPLVRQAQGRPLGKELDLCLQDPEESGEGSEPLGELGSRIGETLCLGPFAQFETDDLALDKKKCAFGVFHF